MVKVADEVISRSPVSNEAFAQSQRQEIGRDVTAEVFMYGRRCLCQYLIR
jgi:hypothetical protein